MVWRKENTKICSLWGLYAAQNGSSLTTFRDHLRSNLQGSSRPRRNTHETSPYFLLNSSKLLRTGTYPFSTRRTQLPWPRLDWAEKKRFVWFFKCVRLEQQDFQKTSVYAFTQAKFNSHRTFGNLCSAYVGECLRYVISSKITQCILLLLSLFINGSNKFGRR